MNALHIKDLNPDVNIYILYRDMRMYGLLEDYYTEARKKGIFFFRYTPDDMPVVESDGEGLTVTFKDHVLGRYLKVQADLLGLSAGMRPTDTSELSTILM
jgi:heterodisulfide reductase subunit A-like polyferredoxin